MTISAGVLSAFGFLMLLTPSIVFLMDGGRNETDFVRWMTGKTIRQLIAMRNCQIMGVGILFMAAILGAKP